MPDVLATCPTNFNFNFFYLYNAWYNLFAETVHVHCTLMLSYNLSDIRVLTMTSFFPSQSHLMP